MKRWGRSARGQNRNRLQFYITREQKTSKYSHLNHLLDSLFAESRRVCPTRYKGSLNDSGGLLGRRSFSVCRIHCQLTRHSTAFDHGERQQRPVNQKKTNSLPFKCVLPARFCSCLARSPLRDGPSGRSRNPPFTARNRIPSWALLRLVSLCILLLPRNATIGIYPPGRLRTVNLSWLDTLIGECLTLDRK